MPKLRVCLAPRVQGCLRSAALHRARRWLLRVKSNRRRGSKATLCQRNERWLALRARGLWENWRNPNTDEWERTFTVITVPSNELVGQIHNRMPAIPT